MLWASRCWKESIEVGTDERPDRAAKA